MIDEYVELSSMFEPCGVCVYGSQGDRSRDGFFLILSLRVPVRCPPLHEAYLFPMSSRMLCNDARKGKQ
jgi:hypothetical protein